MAVLRNINPLGQVDLPLIYREAEPFGQHGSGCLEPGEEFEVSAEHAAILLQQAGNYEPVDAEAIAIDAAIPSSAFRHRPQQRAATGDELPGDNGASAAQNLDGE